MTKIDAAVEAAKVADQVEEGDPNEIVLSTGVVLKAKPIPVLLYMEVSTALPRPPMPKVEYKDKIITNPDDPQYLEEIKHWETENSKIVLNFMISKGTELVSTPARFPKPEKDDWIEELSAIGIQVFPDNKSWRYIKWVLSIAAITQEDSTLIFTKVGRLSGIPEKDVEKATEFPGGS